MKSRIARPDIAEFIEIPSDTENEDAETTQPNELESVEEPILLERMKIKQEKIDFLQETVWKLSSRIGTEIINDDVSDVGPIVLPRYERSSNVNTLHYQLDTDFAKKIYYITDVRIIIDYS